MTAPSRHWSDGHSALLLLLACLFWIPALHGTFVYDDIHSIASNQALRSLGNVPAFFVDPDLFSSTDNRMYRPVLLVTLALNHAVCGPDPWSFKLVNLVLHGATVLLGFGLARRMGAVRFAATAAMVLLAVHPLASEAINLVSGRSELLLLFGLLLAMHGHLDRLAGRRRGLLLSLVGVVIACGSKETGVILPVCLAILELLNCNLARGTWRAAAVRLLPVTLVVACYLLVRLAVLGVATVVLPALQTGSDPLTGYGRSLITQWATMAVALPDVLLQCLWPTGLSLDPHVPLTLQMLRVDVLLGAGLLLVLTWCGLRAPRRRPVAFLGTALAWGTCLPWILVPLNVPLSEHRYYGLLLGLALVAADLLPAVRVRALGLAVAAVGLVFGVLSAVRSLEYRDEVTLWEGALALDAGSFRAHWGLGVELGKRGDQARARGHLERAVSIYPRHRSARISLVDTHILLGERGDPAVALEIVGELLVAAPDDPYLRIQRAQCLIAIGERTGDPVALWEADAAALSCLSIATPKALVFKTAATARHKLGDLRGALALLRESRSLGLDHFSVFVLEAEVLADLGDLPAAEQALMEAERRAPGHPVVRSSWLRLRLRAAAPR